MKIKKIFYFVALLSMVLITIQACNKDDENKEEACKQLTWYQDYDKDGFGNPNKSQQSCTQPTGYISDNTDFDDSNASAFPGAKEICDDGIDNDGDNLIDNDDSDCITLGPEICDDGIDNDGDGLIDNDDSDCITLGPEICDDGIDNDGDGLIDNDDSDCTALGPEDCDDGIDNDGDGLIDCDDPDCSGFAGC